MRTKSKKLSKLEKERFSVFYELNSIVLLNCGSTYRIELNSRNFALKK